MSAGNAENFDGNSTIERALEKLKLDSLVSTLPGMEVALMPHQAIGVAWMLNKEESRDKGGILADEMGLGKVGVCALFDSCIYAEMLWLVDCW